MRLVNNPGVRIFFLRCRIVNRNFTDVHSESGCQCLSTIREDIGGTCRPLVAWLQRVSIRNKCDRMADVIELLQLVLCPRSAQ